MSESKANDRQEGGDHYRKIPGEQHWDRAVRLGFDFFQYMITKYVERCWEKNGLEDLRKALHFTQKYIEVSAAAERLGVLEAKRARVHLALEQVILQQAQQLKTDSAEAARANAAALDWLMKNVIATPDGTFTMPDGSTYDCLRGKPHGTFYDFVHEGSYGDGRKLWTCVVCREKVTTHGAELPHKFHGHDQATEPGTVLQVQGAELPAQCARCLFKIGGAGSVVQCADPLCPIAFERAIGLRV
jgi:hypothetical protein